VVVTSNHGEDLGEHGLYLHNQLYDDILRVPLVIRDPRLPPRPPASATVQTIDVVPTLLDLLGIPRDREMAGTSLAPLLTDPAASLPERDVFGISNRMTTSVRTRTAKLVTFGDAFPHVWVGGTWYRGPGERRALYLLDEDPGETRDALPERPDLVERLQPVLAAWRESVRVEPADPAPVDGQLRDALREDGYWSHVGPAEHGSPRPPPGAPGPA